jgi:hypothetical protein
MTMGRDHKGLSDQADKLDDDVPDRQIAIAHGQLQPLVVGARPRTSRAADSGTTNPAEKKWWRLIAALAAAVVVLTPLAGWLVLRPLPSQPREVAGWAERDTAVTHVAPLLTDLNSDGIDDFVGRFTAHEPRGQFVGAFDGATRNLLWRVGPLDPLPKPRQLAISDQRLAIIADSRLTVHQLTDGRPAREQTLPGEVFSSCANPAQRGPVWLMLADQGLLVDLRTGDLEPAPRPQWCRPRSVQSAPTIAGFASELALVDGQLMIAFGRHTGGATGEAMLLGFEMGDQNTRWQRPIAQDVTARLTELPRPGEQVAMRDGRLYVSYFHRPSNRSRLLAVDGATGETLWRTETLQSAGDSVRATVAGRHHLYVVHGQRLSVYDVLTGKRLDTLGATPAR